MYGASGKLSGVLELLETGPREAVVRRGRRVVELTRLDQVWWREAGLRKRDVVDYYRAIAPVILTHLKDRPFTLKRYPNGPRGPCFWIKDAPDSLPRWIPICPLPAKSRRHEERQTVDYPLVNDVLALLWMVDFGCVDMHLWYSRCRSAQHPDYVLFDLDAAAGAAFRDVARAGLLVRDALEALQLESFVKTSGGEGLHVLVPVARRYTYAQTREFSEIVANALARTNPRLVTTERNPGRRRGVFVDTKMNGHGMTIASAYSVRPRPGAPVSTPLGWEELERRLDPRRLGMRAVLERVERRGDLLEPLLHRPQRLERALARVT